MVTRISPLILFIGLITNSLLAVAAPDGKTLYDEHCSVCHGVKGEGGVGVPLALPGFINSISDEYIFKTIRHGREGRIMPAFQKMSDSQVNAITSFIRTWGDGTIIKENHEIVVGDAEAGKSIYQKRCAQCHGENGQGGKGTGVTFSRKRDLPIIAPALNNPGFLASATDMMIRDTLKKGREGTPMTSGLVADLSSYKLNALVSYIRSLKVEKTQDKDFDYQSPVIIMDSSYSMEETIENLKQAISDQNFMLVRTEPLETGYVTPGEESPNKMVLHFCNFEFLFQALAIDPRVGMFLPCRITVIENKGVVQVMTINPLRLSQLFNNNELDNACREMYTIYRELLEDAVL